MTDTHDRPQQHVVGEGWRGGQQQVRASSAGASCDGASGNDSGNGSAAFGSGAGLGTRARASVLHPIPGPRRLGLHLLGDGVVLVVVHALVLSHLDVASSALASVGATVGVVIDATGVIVKASCGAGIVLAVGAQAGRRRWS